MMMRVTSHAEAGGDLMTRTWSSRFSVVVAALALSATSSLGASATRVAPITALPPRFDPYKNFRFVVKIDGRAVAGTQVMRGLPAGIIPARRFAKNPATGASAPAGQTAHATITMERGVSHDTAFVSWALQSSAAAGAGGPAVGLRRDLVIEVRDETGRLAKAYKLARAWVSVYQALPDLDSGANAVSIAHMVIVGEGIEPTP